MANRLWKAAGNETRAPRYRLIKNSEVIKKGDWITDEATGAANVDGATEKILGLAVAICTAGRVNLLSASVDTGALGGTWDSSTQSYTAAADNATVDGVMVAYIPAKEGDQFVATLDAAKGTTTGSDLVGYYASILTTDSSLLDESDTATSAASCQFRIADIYTQGATTEVIVEVIARQTDQYSMD